MKRNTYRTGWFFLPVIGLMLVLIACSLSSGSPSLSAADQVATGVAATQLSKQGVPVPQGGDQPTQQVAAPENSAPPVTQQLSEAGLSRANPLPPGTLVSVPDWDIQVLEYHRGADALSRINAGYSRQVTAPEGKEIVLVKFFVRCTSFEDKAYDLGIYDLALTGDSHVLYGDQIDEWPQPEFYYYDMFTAEAVEGWLDAVVPAGEQNLMAVVNLEDTRSDSPTYGTRIVRYLALEPGSATILPAEYANRAINDIGMSLEKPAGVGELVSMPEWDITLLEVMGTTEADALLQQNNDFYEAPAANFEYRMLHVKLQYFGEQDWPMSVSFYNFYPTDLSGSRLSDMARYVQNPDRHYISETILPGAEVDGWVILQVPQAGTPYLVKFAYDSYSTSQPNDTRYFKLN